MYNINRQMNLRDVLSVVKKRRAVVLIVFAAFFTLVAFGTFVSTPQYKATTKVMIEKVEPNHLIDRYRGTSGDPEFYQTQIQLIKSKAVAKRVVQMLDLEKNYFLYIDNAKRQGSSLQKIWDGLKIKISSVKKAFSSSNSAKPVDPDEGNQIADSIVQRILNNLIVRPIEGSRIVNISFLSPNPDLSAQVANAIAKAYIEETLEMKMEAARRTLEWMTQKAEGEGKKLETAEKKLQEYKGTHDIVTLENKMGVIPEKLSEISLQLVRAESLRKELEALKKQIQDVEKKREDPETIAAITSEPALQAIRAQIVISEKSIMELSGKYGSKHPVMIKAVADLRTLKRKKNQEISRIVQSIINKYELAVEKENSLRLEFEETKAEALRLNERLIQYNVLQREVDTNRQLHDALMLKLKEQTITKEDHPVNLWIVETANVPKLPAKPMKTLNMLIGAIVGLFGGLSLTFLVDYLDNTVKDPEEAEALLSYPVLGIVSNCKGKTKQPEQILLQEPHSAFAENYKSLRTALLLSSSESPPNRLLITSPGPGEGKTTTAVNLAIALAQSERRVLLIDGDLRKPRIHQIFNLNNNKGLSTYLAGITSGDSLQKGPLPNMAIMPAGPLPPNPSELLISSRMKTLLDNLSHKFDIIICDSPPVLVLADARNLSRVFDGAMLVSRFKQTTFEQAARALKTLRDINANVLGLVINGQDLKESSYYYTEYYKAYERSEAQGIASENVNTQPLP